MTGKTGDLRVGSPCVTPCSLERDESYQVPGRRDCRLGLRRKVVLGSPESTCSVLGPRTTVTS